MPATMKKVLIPLFLLVLLQPAFAQQDTPPIGPEITLHNGFIFAGSGHSMRNQLKDAGFSVRDNRGGLGSFRNNMDFREEGSIQLSVTIPVKSEYRAKGMFNYRDTIVKGGSGDYGVLTIETSVLSLAALGYLPQISKPFRVGIGPSIHFVNTSPILGETVLGKDDFTKPGLVVEGGFSTPANKRFFLDLQLQYFYVGKDDVGSYTLKGTNSSGTAVTKQVDFSKTKFSSLIFSIGGGFRFRKT